MSTNNHIKMRMVEAIQMMNNLKVMQPAIQQRSPQKRRYSKKHPDIL